MGSLCESVPEWEEFQTQVEEIVKRWQEWIQDPERSSLKYKAITHAVLATGFFQPLLQELEASEYWEAKLEESAQRAADAKKKARFGEIRRRLLSEALRSERCSSQ